MGLHLESSRLCGCCAVQETSEFSSGVDVGFKAFRQLGYGGGQRRSREITTTHRVTEEAAQHDVLPLPVAGHDAAPVEKRRHLVRLNIPDIPALANNAGESMQDCLIGFELRAQASSKADVLSNQLIELHSKPARLRFATSRSPVRFTGA